MMQLLIYWLMLPNPIYSQQVEFAPLAVPTAAFRFESPSTWQERIAKQEYSVVEDVVLDESRSWGRSKRNESPFRDTGPGGFGEDLLERDEIIKARTQLQGQLDALFDADELLEKSATMNRISFLCASNGRRTIFPSTNADVSTLVCFTFECSDDWLGRLRRGQFTVVERACIDPAKWNYRFRGNAFVNGRIPILNGFDDIILARIKLRSNLYSAFNADDIYAQTWADRTFIGGSKTKIETWDNRPFYRELEYLEFALPRDW